jgi:hypothetical protein
MSTSRISHVELAGAHGLKSLEAGDRVYVIGFGVAIVQSLNGNHVKVKSIGYPHKEVHPWALSKVSVPSCDSSAGGGADPQSCKRFLVEPTDASARKEAKRQCRVLDVHFDQSEEEVKRAWMKMALMTHPDKGGSEERFVAVRDSWEWLQRFFA